MSDPLPWVGRERELSRIETAMSRSGTAGLLVSGPAGMGKTRLMDQALTRAPATKVVVHRLTATRATATIPMGAVSALLPDHSRRQHGDVLRNTAHHLVTAARGRRVVVAVDDAHALDEASAALVHHLATASPVFVLATVRDGEATPDAVRVLLKDRLVASLPLRPLSADEVAATLERALAGPVSRSVVHRLVTLSDGNPLLTSELLSTALAERRLVQRSGLWCLDGPWMEGAALPTLVGARLSRLSAEVYAAAELVALGEPLGAAEVESLVDPATLAAADREGMFVGCTDGRRHQLRLVHPLYGEALRAAVTPLRARTAYRRLADALAATGARRRGDALRLAIWRLEGGRPGDPELLLRAANEDGALADRSVAERLALAAEAVGGGTRARLVRAEAVRWQGRPEEADALLADIADEDHGDLRDAGHVAAVRASNLYFGLNRPTDADRVLEQARALLADSDRTGEPLEHTVRDELDSLQVEFWFNAGRVGDAADLATAVVRRTADNPGVHVGAATIACVAEAFRGAPRRALRQAAQVLDRQDATVDVAHPRSDLLRMTTSLALAYAGEQQRAEEYAAQRYARALHRHAEELQGEWALALGQLAVFRGRVRTGRRWLREAVAMIQKHSPMLGRYGVAYALCFSAEAAALAGELAAVDTALAETDALLPPGTMLCNRQRPEVWAAAARGDLETARRTALASADQLAENEAHFWEAMACHDVVRLGAPGPVVRRLEQLAGRMEGPVGRLYARHAVALAAADGDALGAISDQFAAHGWELLAAEAAAEASHAYREAGRATRSAALAERSHALAAQCEGARTPALALAHGTLPITAREREVAALARHGLSDREIAERLAVSERTVHNHLHRAYTKLGIRSRGELGSVLP